MTDEQFEKFYAIQVAQLSLLQIISKNVMGVANGSCMKENHNWKAVAEDIKLAEKVRRL